MRTLAFRKFVAPGLLLLASLGCDHACPAIALLSQVTITLHLPPRRTVAPPEMITACRQPMCVTATVPELFSDVGLTGFNFSSPEITGDLRLVAGDIRVMVIRWPLNDVRGLDPSNHFDIRVVDAGGVTTAELSQSVHYQRHERSKECGGGVSWTAEISD